MAKEVSALIKLQIKGGAANPSPPVGPALGSKGVNIMEFCKQFNARTQDKMGKVLPVLITVYNDKSFDFVIKTGSIFINDGAKSAIGNIGHVLGRDNIIAIAEPVYPVYENATIMSGRAGTQSGQNKWSNIVYLRCTPENNFIPELPREKVDVIYLCNPNNPTGTAINRKELKK